MRSVSLLAVLATAWGNYAGLGDFANNTIVRTDYKFRLIDANSIEKAISGDAVFWPAYYQIDIRVLPCLAVVAAGGRRDQCCAGTAEVNCQDNPGGIQAGDDLQIAYFQNAHISSCDNTEFADDVNCGTFIEIHRAPESVTKLSDTEARVLHDVKLTNANGAFATTYISTASLCAGTYELWWVVRTRSGPYVQFRKSFTVTLPSCP